MGRLAVAVLGVVFSTSAFARDSGPCPHPYFPMANGLELTYRAGKSEVQVTFSDVQKEGESLKGVLHLNHKGKDGTTEATCSANGIVTQLGGIEGAALSMSGMDVRVVDSEGIAMPPPDQMQDGATWSNTMSIELRPPSKSKMDLAVVKTKFKKEAIVEGREQIEVAGKTWDALRVRNKITAMAGTAGERSIESMMWLAPEVGILRIKTGESVDFELLKVNPPAATKRAATGNGATGSK